MDKFKPKERHLKLLETYLNSDVKLTITKLCELCDVPTSTYYKDCNTTQFQSWFWEQIQANAVRYAPAIVSGVIHSATKDGATTEDKKLALQVLNIWNPTQKNVNTDLPYEAWLKQQTDKHNLTSE